MKVKTQVVWVLVLTALSIFVASHSASSAPGCLTKQEARAKYPHSHLYWKGSDHCWGDRSIRFRPRHHIDRTAIYARATNKDIFDKNPTTRSHKIIDLDAKLKEECCWPLLSYDANGNIVEPMVAFAERIKNVPTDWWKDGQ